MELWGRACGGGARVGPAAVHAARAKSCTSMGSGVWSLTRGGCSDHARLAQSLEEVDGVCRA
jgi:hypothetical protein